MAAGLHRALHGLARFGYRRLGDFERDFARTGFRRMRLDAPLDGIAHQLGDARQAGQGGGAPGDLGRCLTAEERPDMIRIHFLAIIAPRPFFGAQADAGGDR